MTDQAMEKMPGALMMKVLYICSAMATRTGMQGVAATDTRATGAKPATVSERVNNSTNTRRHAVPTPALACGKCVVVQVCRSTPKCDHVQPSVITCAHAPGYRSWSMPLTART